MGEHANPLTVAILIARLPPEHRGGAELQAERVAHELSARGHRIHLFSRHEPGRPWSEVRDSVHVHRRPVVPIPGLRLVVEVILGAWQTTRCRPDVLLCFMTLNSGLIGLVASWTSGAPFVIWQRGVNEQLLHPLSWRRRLTLFLNRKASALWIQSRSLVEVLRSEYETLRRSEDWKHVEPRIRVVGNAIDRMEEPDADPEPPPNRFLFVGRLVAEKDLPVLLEAARLVSGIEVWIAGTGPLEKMLRDDARSAPVRFLGEQPHEKIPELLRQCRALVLTSREEGLPNVVLEALACGRPVVATPVGSVPELVHEGVNGHIVPVGDAASLAIALRGLTDEQAWRRLAEQARPSVARYSWPALVDRIEEELVQLARKPRH